MWLCLAHTEDFFQRHGAVAIKIVRVFLWVCWIGVTKASATVLQSMNKAWGKAVKYLRLGGCEPVFVFGAEGNIHNETANAKMLGRTRKVSPLSHIKS